MLRSLSISMEGSSRNKAMDLREVVPGLQQHPRAMQLRGSLTERELVGAVW